MKNVLMAAVVAAACGAALAKLPAPVLDEAARAKAAETAARNAWQAKVDAFLLCRAQDRVVAHYRKAAGSAPAQVTTVSTGTAAAMAPASAAAPAAGANVAASPAVAGGTAAAPAGPAAALPPAPCSDPGPFAYNAPSEKPLETSGAHSPAGTAASPPSVNTPAAQMTPAKK